MSYNVNTIAKVRLTGRIIKADGTIIELGELRTTWRSWPVIKPFLAWLWRLKHANK